MSANIDKKALFKIGYGLYLVTSNDGKRDNGLIVNTVSQLTDSPERIGVAINKSNYSHGVILKTGKMNVCCLSTDAPFEVFKHFGFQSGKDTDKFSDCTPPRTENGLCYLPKYINAVISLKVESYLDLGSHGLFICSLTEAKVICDAESMTYAYYHKSVKPKPAPKEEQKRGYVCTVCGYIHDEDDLPSDFVCPICKHGAEVFVPCS